MTRNPGSLEIKEWVRSAGKEPRSVLVPTWSLWSAVLLLSEMEDELECPKCRAVCGLTIDALLAGLIDIAPSPVAASLSEIRRFHSLEATNAS